MKQLIACCGLDCESCDARIATVRMVAPIFQNAPGTKENLLK